MSRKTRRTPMPDLRNKLVIVGDGEVGKTSLLISFKSKKFLEKYVPTVFENYVTHVSVDGKKIELSLWDTSGQEDYARLRPLSYPDTDVILIAFAFDVPVSLKNVADKWVPEITHFAASVPFLLIGLKSDLKRDGNSSRQETGQALVTSEQGQEMAKRIGAVKYMECSAKTREGVDEIFKSACRAIHQKPLKKLKRKFCNPL